MRETYAIDLSWDDEAGVWTAICDELPLAIESNSYDALIEKIKIVAVEIAELNGLSRAFNMLIRSERLVISG